MIIETGNFGWDHVTTDSDGVRLVRRCVAVMLRLRGGIMVWDWQDKARPVVGVLPSEPQPHWLVQ